MTSIFVYADEVNISGELLALARVQGQEANAICLNGDHAAELIQYGAAKVFVLEGANPWPESYGRPIAELLKEQGASAFLVGATVRGRDIAAQAAAYLECALVSDANQCCWVDGKLETSRMMYGGATVLTETLSGAVNVVTIPAGKYEAVKDEGRNGEIITVAVQTDSRVKVIEEAPILKTGTDLSKARRIVGVGMGFDNRADLKLAEDLAAVLGAELGCTRGVAEDRDWLPTESYIGISGVTAKPELYIALGISGQIQHTFGVREARVIVGINNNEKAPIFKSADYGIVGDLYEILPLLTDAIQKSC